jgi:hypothetical protein
LEHFFFSSPPLIACQQLFKKKKKQSKKHSCTEKEKKNNFEICPKITPLLFFLVSFFCCPSRPQILGRVGLWAKKFPKGILYGDHFYVGFWRVSRQVRTEELDHMAILARRIYLGRNWVAFEGLFTSPSSVFSSAAEAHHDFQRSHKQETVPKAQPDSVLPPPQKV